MPVRTISMVALCLMVTACGATPMGSGQDSAANSGSSVTSYESGYGLSGGKPDDKTDGRVDWGE